ncbi:hypothetical protein R3P38DRAFT_3222367 [Favolaschia claudopus]|uniref:Uncharacterized protein n=1 Tax=Favolaschia claudopus TaxID=2862362 RepID=A0AAV9ZYB6_9AGAR
MPSSPQHIPLPYSPSPSTHSSFDKFAPDNSDLHEFGILPLQPYNGAVDRKELSSSVLPVTLSVNIPTLQSSGRIGKVTDTQSRRLECLRIGSSAINKTFLSDVSVAPRRLHSDSLFGKELKLLQDVLSTIQHIPVPLSSSFAYRVHKFNYLLLLRILWNLRKRAEDSLRLLGKAVPCIPSWADDANIAHFYNANDFEILGVCFRAEVENFLVHIDESFDFIGNCPRSPDTSTAHAAAEFARSKHIPTAKAQPSQQPPMHNKFTPSQPRDRFTPGFTHPSRPRSSSILSSSNSALPNTFRTNNSSLTNRRPFSYQPSPSRGISSRTNDDGIRRTAATTHFSSYSLQSSGRSYHSPTQASSAQSPSPVYSEDLNFDGVHDRGRYTPSINSSGRRSRTRSELSDSVDSTQASNSRTVGRVFRDSDSDSSNTPQGHSETANRVGTDSDGSGENAYHDNDSEIESDYHSESHSQRQSSDSRSSGGHHDSDYEVSDDTSDHSGYSSADNGGYSSSS